MTSLYCILARAADTGVIFRRGPTRQVAVIGWNMKDHTFELGQWFKGRIYERKSDLSPDGSKLVYFAAKPRHHLSTWVAVSKPPFLSALVLWETKGTWNEISMFETDQDLALATYRADSSIEPMDGLIIPPELRVTRKPWRGFFYGLADHERLIRDGWVVHTGDPIYRRSQSQPVVYRKPITGAPRSAWLQLCATPSWDVSYAIGDASEAFIDLAADWAEVHGSDIFYSQGAKLLRSGPIWKGKSIAGEPPIELADFSALTFRGIRSPAHARRW